MEYAAGGELFERICNAGRFSEDEVDKLTSSLRISFFWFISCCLCFLSFCFFFTVQARYFFQQLISGVHFCHAKVYTYLHFPSFFPQRLWPLLRIFRNAQNENLCSYDLVMQQICHRDLKLENTLLDGSPAPRLKICDFGYSKVCRLLYFQLPRP